MRRPMALPLVALLVALLVACSGDATDLATIPDARGTYTASYVFVLRAVETGKEATLACSGTLTVSQQVGSNFTGSFIIRQAGECIDQVSGGVNGIVRVGGDISVDLVIPAADANAFTPLTGCTEISSEDLLNGTLIGSRLRVSSSAVLRCPDNSGGTVRTDLDFEIDGTRG